VPAPVFDTVVATIIAVIIFREQCRRHGLEAVSKFRSLAAKILVVSFAPDVLLAVQHWSGGGWPEAVALMSMHVAVWAICVTMLPALVTVKEPDPA
jgi:hypothetical protein